MTNRRASLLPARHLDRYREIVGVLADEGLHTVIDLVGLTRLAPRHRRAQPDEYTWEQHVRHALERLGVTFIKGGQALSTRTDLISPALAAELGKLQDSVPAEPFATVRLTIERELEHPLEELFAEFEEEPIGSASIGQVHRARLLDGRAVAVKVQRPGVRRQVETDLDLIGEQAAWVAEHVYEVRDIDVVGIVAEFVAAVRGELDYAREARSAERLWRAFRDHPTVAFPRVAWSHTTSKVLTLDLLDGVRMNRPELLDEAGFDRAVLAQSGVNAYLRQIFELGFFHADPHPGNFIALPGNVVGFTDFGRTGTNSRESREHFIDLLWAAVNYDAEFATDVFLAMASSPDIDERGLQRDVARLIGKYHGRELGLINPTELFREILGLLRDYHLGADGDFGLVLGTLAVLEGVGTMLDPAFDFAATATPFVERLMRERSRPDEVLARVARGWRRSSRFLEGLPSAIDRILRRASKGEIRVAFVPRDYQGVLDEIAELVNRLAFALVVGALIMGAAWVISATGVPGWVRGMGQLGLVAAFGVTFWFFGSIIGAHYRARRRR